MAASTPFPVQLKLDNTIGVAFVGNIVAAVFYGLTSVQVYTYYTRSKRDKLLLKILISVLWVLDTAHLALITHAIYYYTVSNYSNPEALLKAPATLGVHTVIAGCSDFIVRGIFTYRVWRFSGNNKPLVVAISVFAFLGFLGSPALAAFIIKLQVLSKFTTISWLVYVTFVCGASADILIATSLCVILWRRRTGFRRTDSVIHVLMLYSINTGAMTSIFAIVCILTFAAMPNNLIYFAFFFILPKLLLNSLLATLNARQSLREHSAGDMVSIHLSNIGSSATSAQPASDGARTHPVLEIKMEHSTHQKIDCDSV